MRVLFHSNCQGIGLIHFMKLSPSCRDWEFRIVQNYQLILGEMTPAYEDECLRWADLVFYHAVAGEFPVDINRIRDGVPTIPLAVMYNGGYFMRNAVEEDWAPVLEIDRAKGPEEAANFAVHEADLGYERRWNENWEKMKQKEIDEGVQESMRISDLVPEGRVVQQMLTMNHPSSIVFFHWAQRLLAALGCDPLPDMACYCLADPNAVNLPCEDYACSAAKKHLGLQWGGNDPSNRACWHLAKETIERMRHKA